MLRRVEVTADAVRPAFPLAAETETGVWQTAADGRWTGGFWVGMLWLAAHHTGSPHFAILAREWLARLKSRIGVDNVLNGLVFYYGAALGGTLHGDPQARELAIDAARALDRCFNPVVGIFPLGGDTTEILDANAVETNVDGLAGMTLLHWAAETCDEPALGARALAHACRLRDACQRADGSLLQAARFDPRSGGMVRAFTPRGYADDSAWARAQSWGMLGFVQAARRDTELLPAACAAADFWIKRTAVDPVAFWDFDDPGAPAVERDTSATAMAAATLLKLASLVGDPYKARTYRLHAEMTVDQLAAVYLTPTKPEDHRPSGMLIEGCWQRRSNMATRHELIWGNYFLLEALLQVEGSLPAI